MSVVHFIERRVSPIVTTGLAILGLPNRKALVRSLGEQVKLRGFAPAQLEALRLLLEDHDIIQEEPRIDSIDQLKHFHLAKTLTWQRVSRFVSAFNQTFAIEGLEISISRRQFSISQTEVIQATLADEEASAWAKIAGVLVHAGLPLSLTEIEAELFEPRDQIAEELGAARENGRIIRTYAEEGLEPRYYLASRDAEMTGQSVLVFRSGETAARIFKRDAERLRQADRACKVITSGGDMEFISAEYLAEHSTDFVPVKARLKNFLAAAADTSKLLEQGLLVVGLETDSSEPCYILASRQKQYLAEIFRSFAGRYIDVNDSESYQKLEAAFKLARAKTANAPVENLLTLANQVAKLGGSLIAIILVLCPDEADISKLAATKLFTPEEIAHFNDCQHRAHYVFHHPLLVNFGFSYGLQNIFHAWYDKLGHFEVLQVVLARKNHQLRQIAENSGDLPQNLKHQIEVLYAPLAESNGFIDLANDMRDLVFRITEPDEYAGSKARQEADLSLPREQAERHLEFVAAQIAGQIERQGAKITSTLPRLKELYATVGKPDHYDDLGIRFTCQTIADARNLTRLLKNNFMLPSDYGLKIGKNEIEDYLEQPNKNGWRGFRIYIVDPTQEDDGTPKRIIAVQVLTDRMQKEDKMGQAGHWFYKACRAARKMFDDLGWQYWRQQTMDPPPIDRYNGDAEHDLKIDVEIARQHLPVYFDVEDFDPFSQKTHPALRLQTGDTVEDLLAFKSMRTALIDWPLYIELYLLRINGVGQATLVPWEKGQARLPAGAQIPGQEGPESLIAIIKQDPKANETNHLTRLRQARKTVQTPRARLLIDLRVTSSDRHAALFEEGAKLANELGIKTKAQAEEVRHFAELQRAELYPALALGIISEDEVKQAIGVLKPKVKLEPAGNGELVLTVRTPDQAGLLAEISQHLKHGSVTSLTSKVIPHARRASLVDVALTIKPSPSGEKSVDIVRLQESLDAQSADQTPKGLEETTYVHQVELTILPTGRDWEVARKLLPAIADLGLNITSANLPSLAKDKQVGKITIEIPSNEEHPQVELSVLLLEIATIAPDLGFNLSIIS